MNDQQPLAMWQGERADVWRARWAVPELLVFDVIGSTNDVIKARAETGAPAGTLAIAEMQTRGRGRRDRRWDAPFGTALLMSMLFRPLSHSPADLAGTIPLRVGMAVARAIESVCDVDIRLKWPNDLMACDGRKVAGILCESSLASTGVAYTVVGIGINVLQNAEQLHDDGANSGVSLQMLSRGSIDRAAIASAVIAALLPIAEQPAAPLTRAELADYASRDALAARIVTADGTPVGTAAGISELGELRVDDGLGVRSIHAGTIRAV